MSYLGPRAAIVAGPPHRLSSLHALEYIDMTFCRSTTFSGTFWLRDGLRNLRCIRRQPKWMDGHFHTPFGSEHNVEIHTYWPDGTFQFTRNEQSNGFVSDLYAWKGDGNGGIDEPSGSTSQEFYESVDFVGDKLQYNNSSLPHPLPIFTQYAYRPGVSLMKLPPEYEVVEHHVEKTKNDKSSSSCLVSCVLVAQTLDGLKPPSSRRWMEQAIRENIPLGQSKYYGLLATENNRQASRGDIKLVETLSPEAFAASPQGQRPVVMISKMKLEPLGATIQPSKTSNDSKNENVLMPPDELVEACRETCKGMLEYGVDFLERLEEEMHQLLQRPEMTADDDSD
mmetsp:Transcript_22248/g.39125  ORF Transcript_22248/g.39125 Transcript_22248/m.39125 type:complete len:339 (+) Transcript_22248:1-1017(+)